MKHKRQVNKHTHIHECTHTHLDFECKLNESEQKCMLIRRTAYFIDYSKYDDRCLDTGKQSSVVLNKVKEALCLLSLI